MGYTIHIICKSCGIDREYNLGQGIKDFDKDRIASYFTDIKKKEVETTINKGCIYNFEYVLTFCSACEKMERIPRFAYFEGNEQKYIIDNCECGCIPKIILDTEESENTNLKKECPLCKNMLDINIVGMYD